MKPESASSISASFESLILPWRATSSPTPSVRFSMFLCSYRPFSNDPTIRLKVLLPMSIAQIGTGPSLAASTVAGTIMKSESAIRRATKGL